jgi:PAS domain S-box-containing protein
MAHQSRLKAQNASKAEMIAWLFANSRDLMHLEDAAGRLALVNPAWPATVATPEGELIGRPFRDFVHPDDLPPHGAETADGPASDAPGEVLERELRLRRADGGWAWFAARVQPLADGRRIVTLRDAAEAHARAEELAELRRTRDMLCLSAGVGMWSYDPVTDRLRWSERLLRRMGLRPDQLTTPADFKALTPAADHRRLQHLFSDSVTSGRPAQLEHRIRMNGGWGVVRMTCQAEPLAGGRHALLGLTEDITELAAARDAARRGERRMREARREALASSRRLKLALEVAQAGVYEIDHVAQTFWASPEFRRLAGERNDSYADVAELRYPPFHPDDLDHVRECFHKLHHGQMASGEGFDARIVGPSGQARWVRIFHHLVVARNGRWRKAVGLLHDIDADKRQELALIEAQRAAEAAAEAKANFLANMSHEIRTPLNGVLGVLHLLEAESLSADGRMLLKEATSCGQMLAEILDDVIDFSKIEAGRLDLACEPVEVKALVDGVVQMLQPQAQAKGLTLSAEAAAEWVRSDPVRLRQGLFNLVGNAVKFTERGHVGVRVIRSAPGRLRFEVQDTGVGIPAEAQGRIFERFNQGDASTTRRFGGSGLGLPITRRLAQLMGGDVGFTSVAGQGSTFWLEVAAEPAAAQALPDAAAGAVLDGLRILVVEDNATNRLIATKLLEQLGAAVETAADGYLGVAAAARGGFDLILMDVQMPGIDGPEAARRIRALPPPASRIPIIALTANVLAHQREAYRQAGMDGVVGKPISPPALLGEIARLAGGAETPEPRRTAVSADVA